MNTHLDNTSSLAGLLGLLLVSPGLVQAEDYYAKTRGYRNVIKLRNNILIMI
jgi:hypothetical protein